MGIDRCADCATTVDEDETPEVYRDDFAHVCLCDKCYDLRVENAEYEASKNCGENPRFCACAFHKGLKDEYADNGYQQMKDAALDLY